MLLFVRGENFSRMRNGFRKTMQKRDSGLKKRSNASQIGSQGPYIAYGQFRRLCAGMLKRILIQKAGI